MSLLFEVLATILMFINTTHVIYLYVSLRKSKKYRMLANKKIQMVYMVYVLLLVCFLIGYIFILFYNNGDTTLHLVISQLLFWGACFVMISMQVFKSLIHTMNQQFFLEKSDLQLSLDTYLKSIPGGVRHCETEPELRVTYVNKGFTDIFGYTIDDIKETYKGKYTEVIHKDDVDTFLSTMDHLIKTVSSATITYRLIAKSGETIWVSDSMNAVKDSKGATHIFSVVMNITNERTNAETDSLTGLLNKRAFNARTKEYMRLNPEKNIGLFMVDLDFFKEVNDQYGHQRGDLVLIEVAKYLHSVFSDENAVIGRIGGDEFMAFLKDVPSDQYLLHMQNRINAAFKIKIPDIDCFDVNQSPSIYGSTGYAFAKCTEDFDTIYRRADASMYRAKELVHAMRNRAMTDRSTADRAMTDSANV